MLSSLDDLFWSEINADTLLPAAFVMALFALLLRRLIGKKDDRVRNLPFRIITVVLVLLEILKQIRDLSSGTYSFWSLPLHFSSLGLYLFPFAHFGKGRAVPFFRSAAGTVTAMSSIGTFLFPMTIFGNSAAAYFRDFGAFHTITYHYALILYAFLFLALRIEAPERKKDLKALFLTLAAFCLVAAPAANLLGVNFTSFLSCDFPPVEAMRNFLRTALGTGIGQTLYVLFMVVAIYVHGILTLSLRTALDGLFEKTAVKKAARKAA